MINLIVVLKAVIFCLVVYNIIFIPLQLAFNIQFKGWLIFIEIATLCAYILDILLKFKEFRNIKPGLIAPESSIGCN